MSWREKISVEMAMKQKGFRRMPKWLYGLRCLMSPFSGGDGLKFQVDRFGRGWAKYEN